MAGSEAEAPAAPEIDVDALDDAAFADLKTKMRSGEPASATQQPKDDQAATTVVETGDQPSQEPSGDDDDDTAGKQETVPHKKFHQANERRKAAEARAQEQQDRADKAMARLQQLLEAQAQPEKPSEPEIPVWDTDPLNAGRWTQQEIIEVKKQLAVRAEQEAQAAQRGQVLTAVNERLMAAKASDPSIGAAHDALRQSLLNEYVAFGYTEQAAKAEISRLEIQHAEYIAANNLDPAVYIKNWAKGRGWAPAAQQQPQESEAEKLNKLEQARLASQSLGKGAGSVADTGRISPQDILDMSDEEFLAYKNKHGSVAHAFRAA